MKIVTALIVLLLFGSGVVRAQWKEGDKRIPDAPDRKSVNGFGGNLLVVEDPKGFIEQWKKPETPQINPASLIDRDELFGVLVLFAGCKPDDRGICNAEVDYAIYKPDGSLYVERKKQPLWKEEAPKPQIIQMSQAILLSRLEARDPLGVYKVKARISDLNAQVSFELETKFRLQ